MKKILILTKHLNIGGAEKSLVRILHDIDLKKYKVELVLIFNEKKLLSELPDGICISYIFPQQTEEYKERIRCYPEDVYKSFIKTNYDIEIAFLEGYPTALIASGNNKSYKIAWIHSDFTNNHHSKKAYSNDEQERIAYKQYNQIICCSEAAMNGFKYFYSETVLGQTFNIHYSLPTLKQLKDLSESYTIIEELPYFCTLARLAPEKGIDRIIYASNILKNEGFNFKCLIFGDGLLKKDLQHQIKSLNLEQTVILMGSLINPYPYLRNSIAYVCSSLGESLCLSIYEALLLSIPVVACQSTGTSEILKDGMLGYLVSNDKYGVLDGMRHILQSHITKFGDQS